MTITASYSRAHRAFQCVAREHGLYVTDVRVLVALRDLDGEATKAEVAYALDVHREAVYRSLRRLAPRYLERVGRASLAFTDAGRKVACEAIDRCKAVPA